MCALTKHFDNDRLTFPKGQEGRQAMVIVTSVKAREIGDTYNKRA